MTEADRIRIREAADRAIAAIRRPVIIGQTAPILFSNRMPNPMPYLRRAILIRRMLNMTEGGPDHA